MKLINNLKKYITNTHRVTILNEDWKINHQSVELRSIPNQGDLIYVEDANIYYEVIKIIYYLNNKNAIFIVVKPLINENN